MGRPIFMITADGSDITAMILGRLLSLTVTDQAGLESDRVEILLDDSDDLIEPPRRGAKLKVWLGYAPEAFSMLDRLAGLVYKGEYTVEEVDISIGPDELRISAKAADLRESAKSPKTWAFDDDPTLKTVLGKIASDEKLELKIAPELVAKSVGYLAQTEESNLNLMTRLAARFDAIAKVADGKLIFARRGSGQSVSGKPMPEITLSRLDIIKARGKLKDRERFGAVTARWHHQGSARKKEVTEKQGEGPVFTLRETYLTEAEARDACKAKLAEMQRREADVSIEIEGLPDAAAEAKLILAGVSRKLDGEYIAKQVRHILKGSRPGYRTQIEGEPPGRKKEKGK